MVEEWRLRARSIARKQAAVEVVRVTPALHGLDPILVTLLSLTLDLLHVSLISIFIHFAFICLSV